jgi:hypothetical protein
MFSSQQQAGAHAAASRSTSLPSRHCNNTALSGHNGHVAAMPPRKNLTKRMLLGIPYVRLLNTLGWPGTAWSRPPLASGVSTTSENAYHSREFHPGVAVKTTPGNFRFDAGETERTKACFFHA